VARRGLGLFSSVDGAEPRWLTAKRLRLWAAALAVAFWLPVLAAPFKDFWDFSAFYSAGALVGRHDLSSLFTVVDYERQLGLPITPFVNPPAYALLYAPLASLPYGMAGCLSLAFMLACLIAAVEFGRRCFGLGRPMALLAAFAWPPAVVGVVSGQTSSLALLLVVFVIAGLQRRDARGDALAGIAVAALAYKPQLALPLFGLLLLRANWRALSVGLAGVVALYLLGGLATGGNWGWPADWIDALRNVQTANSETNDWQSVSLPGLCSRLTIPTPIGYVAGGILILWSFGAMRSRPIPAAVALTCVLGLVVSPHALIYDASLVLPGLALTVDRPRWVPTLLFVLAAVWPVGAVLGWQPMALALPVFAWYLATGSVEATPAVSLRGSAATSEG
jgi:hypothetical protein